MDFQTAVRTCLNKYTDFQGRAQRSEYWWFALFSLLVQLACTIVDSVLGSEIGIVALLAMLALFLPSLAVTIRRLHDQDRSGWWVLLILIPFIGSLVLLIMLIFKGTEGPNRFGQDPLGAHAAAELDDVSYSASNIPNVKDND